MSINPMSYETQFFGFTPQTCLLRVYNAFQDYLFDIMLIAEQVILRKLEGLPDSNISSSQIREGTESFLIFMKERFEQLFGKMESILLNFVLSIPENVLLPADKVHEQYSYSKEEFQQLEREVKQLQMNCSAEAAARQELLVELDEQKATEAELQKTLRWFDSLENAGKENGIADFTESLAFLTRSASEVSSKLKEIEEKSKSLGEKPDVTDGGVQTRSRRQ
ncbi:protein MIS12 homolog [Protopterus annectens]|uniref:protein MIS12 homolog n=1 Tax=Protopterus annectens TaxID=7888 RepID=UPI001CFAFABA|nr:protein MIS12 homolog [Protopterus annectens]XP_043909975.1 protein MIS12 homolog [Protopterus annectens]